MRAPELKTLPPASKMVYLVLEYDGPLTQKELAEQSMLSPRTVRDALGRLIEAGLVAEDLCIPDARQRLYRADAERPVPRRAR